MGYSFFNPYDRRSKAVPKSEVPSGTVEWWFVHRDAILPKGWSH